MKSDKPECLPQQLWQDVNGTGDVAADVARALLVLSVRAERHGLRVGDVFSVVDAGLNRLRVTVEVRPRG